MLRKRVIDRVHRKLAASRRDTFKQIPEKDSEGSCLIDRSRSTAREVVRGAR